MKLIPVKYHNKNYPEGIIPLLVEVAGNLDSKAICQNQPYSLHTEYSYMKRKFDSELLNGLEELKDAHKDGVPQLWKSIKWSEEFAVFIERLVGDSIAPEVIEIHPPFKDYCKDISTFWERYIVFYRCIIRKFPETKIIIENRCGTYYKGSKFLIYNCNDVIELCQYLANGHTELGIIVDYPQLFSAEKIKMDNVKTEKILQFNKHLKPYASFVWAIHLWGKRKSKKGNRWSPHSGDLNTFFSNDSEKKNIFLKSMINTFDDDIKRYFVPEVNTSEQDLKNIVNDLVFAGIIFVQAGFKNYLLAVDWEEKTPKLVLYNNDQNSVWECNAIGKFSFLIGDKKYCIGNKEIVSNKYLGCSNHTILKEKKIKCPDCIQMDLFKNCVKCTGNHCYVKNQEVLDRCNQEHVVYLAYFSGDVIKVGVAHARRKYSRLLEQGALYSIIIATCRTGKIARQLESSIRKIGIKDKVSSKYKIHNLGHFDIEHANEKLLEQYNYVMNELDSACFENIKLIDPPKIVEQRETLSILEKLSFQENKQLTLLNYMNFVQSQKEELQILDNLDGFEGEVIAFIGMIALLKKEKKYYLFDFKNLIGKEMHIITDRERN